MNPYLDPHCMSGRLYKVWDVYYEWMGAISELLWRIPPLSRMFCAVGCHTTSPTLLWCATRSTTHSSMLIRSPPSGICHTFTVQSSEAEAMTSSLCGHHCMSSTAALWPVTMGASRSIRPVYKTHKHIPLIHIHYTERINCAILYGFIVLQCSIKVSRKKRKEIIGHVYFCVNYVDFGI